MEQITWTTERRKVSELVAWDKNPRKISDEQLEHLKQSITRFGYAAPVVVNADGRLIAGHMRCVALRALGRGDEVVDVRVPSRLLTDEEAKELTIRDNANGGDWDLGKMVGLDLESLSEWGFDPNLVDRLRAKVKEDDFDAEKRVAEIVEPRTKPGDMYALGEHRLLCGDSTKRDDFKKLMGGGRHSASRSSYFYGSALRRRLQERGAGLDPERRFGSWRVSKVL